MCVASPLAEQRVHAFLLEVIRRTLVQQLSWDLPQRFRYLAEHVFEEVTWQVARCRQRVRDVLQRNDMGITHILCGLAPVPIGSRVRQLSREPRCSPAVDLFAYEVVVPELSITLLDFVQWAEYGCWMLVIL